MGRAKSSQSNAPAANGTKGPNLTVVTGDLQVPAGVIEKAGENVQSIATQLEYGPYLDAVTHASQRTRATIYLLIAVMIAIFAAVRASHPAWNEQRLKTLVAARSLWGNGEPLDSSAYKAAEPHLSYAAKRGFSLGEMRNCGMFHFHRDAEKAGTIRSLDKQIDIFLQKRTDVRTTQLPIFGVPFDTNDLWMLSGLGLGVILFVLSMGLARELDNLKRAKQRARDPHDLEVLLMHQVLSSPSKSWIVSLVTAVAFLLPFALHLAVFVTDVSTLDIANTLTSPGTNAIDYALETVSVVAILVLCWTCLRRWRDIDHLLADLAEEVRVRFSSDASEEAGKPEGAVHHMEFAPALNTA